MFSQGIYETSSSARLFIFVLCTAVFASPSAPGRATSAARTHLLPRFAAGQVFRYSIQTKIETTAAASGVIADPQAPKKLEQTVDATIRLEVLSASPNSAQPSVRLRVTYEKVATASNGPAYDPDVAAIRDQYQKLNGQSFEFTLGADGKISGVTGLNVAADPSRAAVINQWLSQLTFGASLPKHGIAVGEKWSSEQSLENIPLDGLAWKARATYVRDEPCPSATQPAAPVTAKPLTPAPSAANMCAVILTRSTIVGGEHSKDRTPAVFRQNGLRTSGIWTGTGEALTSISLRTGMVSSVTQTGSTHMDFTIMTTLQRNRMRYAGDTHTQSNITLLSESAVP